MTSCSRGSSHAAGGGLQVGRRDAGLLRSVVLRPAARDAPGRAPSRTAGVRRPPARSAAGVRRGAAPAPASGGRPAGARGPAPPAAERQVARSGPAAGTAATGGGPPAARQQGAREQEEDGDARDDERHEDVGDLVRRHEVPSFFPVVRSARRCPRRRPRTTAAGTLHATGVRMGLPGGPGGPSSGAAGHRASASVRSGGVEPAAPGRARRAPGPLPVLLVATGRARPGRRPQGPR